MPLKPADQSEQKIKPDPGAECARIRAPLAGEALTLAPVHLESL